MLKIDTFGTETQNPTLLIAHGLFGAGRNWRSIARRLSYDRRVITVDMRNHGESFWDPSHTYIDMATDLSKVITSIGSPVDLLGHSMGGKAAMTLSLTEPKKINRLIIADIAPILYSHSQMSNIKVMQSIPLAQLKKRSDADIFMADYISNQMVRSFLLQSLVIETAKNTWELNLTALAANMDNIIDFPSISSQFNSEVLFIKGALSSYIILPDHKKTIIKYFPKSTIKTIENAGHWLHAEAPKEFISLVQDFIK